MRSSAIFGLHRRGLDADDSDWRRHHHFRSWPRRIVAGVMIGMIATATLFNVIGSDTNPDVRHAVVLASGARQLPSGMMFMATDRCRRRSPTKERAYGALIGAMCVLIRVVNPAYPEGMMLAILFCQPLRATVRLRWCRPISSGGSRVAEKKSNDSIGKTLLVVLVLCTVCSVIYCCRFCGGAEAAQQEQKRSINSVTFFRRRADAAGHEAGGDCLGVCRAYHSAVAGFEKRRTAGKSGLPSIRGWR